MWTPSSLFLLLDELADLVGAARVNRGRPVFDVLNPALFIQHERGPAGPAALFVENAVLLRDLPLEIAEQGEGQSQVVAEALVGGEAIHADSNDLALSGFEFGDINLIRLELLRSPAGEGKDVKRQHHVLLAPKVAELHGLAGLVGQGEVRGKVAYFQAGGGRRWLLCKIEWREPK